MAESKRKKGCYRRRRRVSSIVPSFVDLLPHRRFKRFSSPLSSPNTNTTAQIAAKAYSTLSPPSAFQECATDDTVTTVPVVWLRTWLRRNEDDVHVGRCASWLGTVGEGSTYGPGWVRSLVREQALVEGPSRLRSWLRWNWRRRARRYDVRVSWLGRELM